MKNILKKLGYIHKDDITEDFLCSEMARIIGDPGEYGFPKEEEVRLFAELSSVNNYGQYLRSTAAKDIERYMSAPDDNQRAIVRGAFMRTNHMRSLLSKKKSTNTKLEGLRYNK